MPPSSPPFAATLTLEAAPDRIVAAVLVGAYGIAAIALSWLAPIWTGVIAGALAVALAGDLVRLRRPARLQWSAEGPWYDRQRPQDGPLELAAPTFVSRWIVVLVLVDRRGRVRRYLISRSGVSASQWRRLLARLRVEGGRAARPLRGWRSALDEA